MGLNESFINVVQNKVYLKIVAVSLILMAMFGIFQYAYLQGKMDQCIETNGFLLLKTGTKEDYCANETELKEMGYKVNQDKKQLEPIPFDYEYPSLMVN